MQSMENKEICILVVHDDPIYRNIVAKMLHYCSHYEVMKQRISDALITIREKKDRLNLFVTDINRSNTNGFEILQHIEQEFKLDIMLMSPYADGKLVSIGLGTKGRIYFLKSWSVNDFKSLWRYAYAQETSADENAVDDQEGSFLGNTNKSLFGDRKRKRRESKETLVEQNDHVNSDDDDSPSEKRQRVVWSDWMHHKFVDAIKLLGPQRAFPKKILEVMNVPGLTRESVASHLQKYRQGLRRAEEVIHSTGAVFGSNFTTHLNNQKCFTSSHSAALNLGNCLYLNQEGPNYSCSFHHPEPSTPSTSNLGHEQLLTGTYPYGHSVSSSIDTIAAQNSTNLFDFGTTELNSQTRLAQVDSGCVVPGTQVNHSYETRKSDSSSNVVSAYVGYRLAGNGKSVESGQMVVVSGDDDENRTDKVSLFAGGSGNESLVKMPLVSGGFTPQQQPPYQPPVLPVAHDLDNLGAESLLVQNPLTSSDHNPLQQPSQTPIASSVLDDLGCLGGEGEVDRLLGNASGSSTSPQFFWNDDFDDAFFNHTD